ncbi:ParB/RepB/Spo0J family partition protein [Bradyrhizobium genosp. A]|uniref:ParB/RepB/Spo0J family partition protein n=1 Tax=Bradyrhizobium genosp. A TaxID=83626 RepID=UPI003CF9A572
MTATTQAPEAAVTQTGATLFIPLHRLKKSPQNARKTPHPKADIEALAASIAAKGLLQNLVVEPEQKDDGKPTGYYLVTIGEGRRLAHLLRAKRKEITKAEPVRCILDTAHNAHEISLAENVIRSAMHPADQFEAFAKLHREDGMAAEDIAARFGVTATVVRQRLKLGAVSPKLMQAYRDEELSLDELTAFAITDDHARQEQVWDELPPYHRSRDAILRALSEGQVSSDDRRAAFVGAEAYQAAGGTIIRDLFDEDGGGFFADAALLNRLVREKLATEAAKIEAEGWKWIIMESEFNHEMTAGMRRVYPEAAPLSDEDQARLGELEQRHNALSDEDDGSDDNAAELQELEAEIDALTGAEQYQPDDIAIAGAFVCLDHRGEPRIERGFVRAEDWKAKPSKNNAEPDGEGGTTDPRKPLSEKLVAELTAYRTVALRNALALHPATALTAVVHALAAAAFFSRSDRVSCLEITPRSASLASHAPRIDECPAMAVIAERHAAWERRMPDDTAELWGFVARLDQAEQLELLAHCASLTLNAMHLPKHRTETAASTHAERLAETLGLDMTATWTPTVESYFGRVSKERIVEAVREGVSVEAAANLMDMKKLAMAEAAERRLGGTGWLPELLRTGPVADVPPAA